MNNDATPVWIIDFLSFISEHGDVRLDYLPLFVNSFLADDNVETMNTEQKGAYLLILMRAWMQQIPASIPDDDERLCKWAGVTKGKWTKMRDVVLRPFVKHSDDRLYQKRLAQEWIKAARVYLSRRRGAEVTNAGRSQKPQAQPERDAERAEGERNTQPKPPNPNVIEYPTQPKAQREPSEPAPPVGSGSGESSNGSGSVRVGNVAVHQAMRNLRPPNGDAEFERQGKVQQILNSVDVNQATVSELSGRRDITPDRVKTEIAKIRASPNVDCLASVLVKRLRNLN